MKKGDRIVTRIGDGDEKRRQVVAAHFVTKVTK